MILVSCSRYLPLVVLLTIYLSRVWFEGLFIWPLTIVALVHFILAAVFAMLAWHRWKVTEELNKEATEIPKLTAP